MMEELSWGFKKYVIDLMVPFPTILAAAGVEVDYGSVYCPFHDNTDTPAARLYSNEDKGDTLYCWAEQRVYRPSDVLTKKLLPASLDTIFERVWKRLPAVSRVTLMDSYERPATDISDVEVNSLLEKLAGFRAGEYSLQKLLSLLL